MKRFITNRNKDRLLAAVLVLAAWQVLTFFYSPLVVPTIAGVAAKLGEIASQSDLRGAIILTARRLLAGLTIGVAGGCVLGIALGFSARLQTVFKPVLSIMQAVPPISWLVLAMIWFGFNGKPSVFIVVIATLLTIIISVTEGMKNIDPKLDQMCTTYTFTAWKRLRFLVIPSVAPYFQSGLRVALGTGCKTIVMGELLTTNSGIGGMIMTARLNIEPESVVAWTVVIVVLFYALDKVVDLFRDKAERRGSHHS
jgi:NitT/TauT family transport system permease protein